MNPLYFGSSAKRLFGIYSAPSTQPARNRGVVVCNPFGDEAIKAHRALRELANRLAADRFHALRFDYFGTGDSAGDADEGNVAQWLEDVGMAADELKDASGVTKLSFVGLRLGASLALQAAASRRDVDRVALWDPVVRGGAYLEYLRRAHREYLHEEFHWRPAAPSPAAGEEIMGFPLRPEVSGAFEALDLTRFDTGEVKRAVLVTSNRSEEVGDLVEALKRRGVALQHEFSPVGPNWNSDASMESSLVPTEAIESIVAALA